MPIRYHRKCNNCKKNYIGFGSQYCSPNCKNIALTGIKRSSETKNKLRLSKLNNKNPMWRGDNVSYITLHHWVTRHKPKPLLCSKCKKIPPYDLANISGEYKRDINDFKWLCRSCHMREDGRMNNLKQFQKCKKIN